jgi:predicted nucleic acid-binding protein
VTKVVVDASAGVEIAAETSTGKALRQLIPSDAELWVPEHFFAECGAVLRKWSNGGLLTGAQLDVALGRLLRWPVRRVQVRELFRDAWALRHNVTFGDALYVALAADIGASLLTGDHRLAAAPTLPIQVLHLSQP